MPWFELTGLVVLAAAIAGLILMALLVWLQKTWTARAHAAERKEFLRLIEDAKADLARTVAESKASLPAPKPASSVELDRKRDVYTELSTTLRLLLQPNLTPEQLTIHRATFLSAYDIAYLTASEPILATVRELLSTLETKIVADRNLIEAPRYSPSYTKASALVRELETALDALHHRCLMEMRKDCGFSSPVAEPYFINEAAPAQIMPQARAMDTRR